MLNQTKEPEGLLLVDKAKGASSFNVVSKVRRALGTRAVGHVGTLDPLASGLLVFLIGRYTRLSNYLMAGEKQYRAVIEFGSSTTTDDKEGEVLATAPAEHITADQILLCLPTFLGLQQQVPPAFSAISINGVRAYRRARAGEEVEMAPREIEIRDLTLVDYNYPFLTIDVTCSKGTYIRSLARDLGARMGVPSHLADLRRTKCSGYDVLSAISEADLSDPAATKAHLQNGLSAVRGLDIMAISAGEAGRLRNGLRVDLQPTRNLFGGVFLTALGDDPVALCRIEKSQLLTVRGF